MLNPPTFYLGTHKARWLADSRFVDVPLFVSRRTLTNRRSLPRATGRWALDSGGFTELSTWGRWTVSAERYAAEARRFAREIGGLDFAAVQDWMCEPWIVEKTGLSVEAHQRRSIASYLELRRLAPEIPWLPVLQGWTMFDYVRHLEMYDAAGVDLRALPRVGVGSVCRRQSTLRASLILRWLRDDGIRIHAFGFKVQGLETCGDLIVSADSMAWSYNARRRNPGAQNRPETALAWAARIRRELAAAEPIIDSGPSPVPMDVAGLVTQAPEFRAGQLELDLAAPDRRSLSHVSECAFA